MPARSAAWVARTQLPEPFPAAFPGRKLHGKPSCRGGGVAVPGSSLDHGATTLAPSCYPLTFNQSVIHTREGWEEIPADKPSTVLGDLGFNGGRTRSDCKENSRRKFKIYFKNQS